VEDRADERVSPGDRDDRGCARVDERRRRPPEQHERGEGEDEAERDTVRVRSLDWDREALSEGRGEEERADARDRRPGARISGKGDGRYCIRGKADERDRRHDREQPRGWMRPATHPRPRRYQVKL